MKTNSLNNSFSLLSYKKLNSIGRHVATIAAILFLAMPKAWAEIRYIGGISPAATIAAGDGAGHSHPNPGVTPVATKYSNLGITCNWIVGGTTLDLSKIGSTTTIITIAFNNKKYYYSAFVSSTAGIYPTIPIANCMGKMTFTAPDGVYFCDSTNFRLRSNNPSNTAYFAYNQDASASNNTTATTQNATYTNSRISTSNTIVFWKPLSGPTHSFYITALSSANYKPIIREQWFYYQIPEVITGAMQHGAGNITIPTITTKNTTSEIQSITYDVLDGIAKEDFTATITPNQGVKGTFSTPSLSFNKATQKLTVTFTYTSANSDAFSEGYGGTLTIGSLNTLNSKTFSTTISGTVGSAKANNNLAWNIEEDQKVNTTYDQTDYLTGFTHNETPIYVSSNNTEVAEVLTSGAIIFKKAGTVTITVTQAGYDAIGDDPGCNPAGGSDAGFSREFTVTKRTAILAYSESTLFVNTEYPGLISVTNDPNGTLLPNLSYSGADTYMNIEETGDVATKSARTASTTLTITYAGDDEWNPVSTSHDFKVVNKLPAPPFCLADLDNISERVSDGVFITKETNGSFAWNGSALQVTTTGNTYIFVTVRFDGIPNKISFTPSTNIPNLTIKESSDGVSFASIRPDASATAGTKVEVAFTKPASRYVQIGVRVSSSGGTVNLNNFCISDKPMFTVSPSVAYVKTDGITSTPAVIRVVHNDMRSITVTSSDTAFTISEWTTESGSPIGEGNNGVVQAEVDFVGSDYSKTATLTLTGVPSSGDNIIQTVTVRLNAKHDRHYAKGRAYVVSESGSGTVYVGATEDAPVSSAYRVNSETQKYCSAEMGETDDLTFHYWAKAGAGYEFEGWYRMYEEETAELSDLISSNEHFSIDLHATSTDPENPTTGTLYANFIETVAADAPIFALEDLNLGSVVSGEGNLQGNLVLQPVGEATRPLYIDRDRTTVAFTDIAGHEGEAALFSAGAYSMGLKAFAVTFAQTGVHPTSHTYQALATVTATNDMGTNIHTAVVSATVTPAALASFTVDASHTFADKQRNQTDTWNAVVGSLTNATTTPVITITGANAEYFSAGAWDAENHLFPITFAPTAVGANYTATATISVQNYDEVVTSHTITLTGTCVAAPLATYDVQNSEGQSVVNSTGVYFGDFTPGDAAMRTLYIVDLQNIKEAAIPSITIIPEGMFSAGEYNTTTQSFDVTFTAEESEQTVQNAIATIMVLNNDEQLTMKNVPLSAFLVKQVDYDVRVTDSEGHLIEGGETNWESGLALANANANSTLTLMRHVNLTETYSITSTQTVSNTFTLDLNGKTLSEVVAGTMMNVNTSGKTLTIKDSKMGGKIQNIAYRNSSIYTLNVAAGAALNVESGTVYVENTAQYAYGTSTYTDGTPNLQSMQAHAIHMAPTSTVHVKGGKIHAVASRNAFGIYEENNASNTTTLTVSGGEIIGEAPNSAYGIYAYGIVNMSGGTVAALVNDKTVDGNTTYTANAWNDYTLHRYGYGIRMVASADKIASNCYYGTLNVTGGTINATNVNKTMNGTSPQTEHTYGIYMDFARAGMGTSTLDAEDGTNVQKASAIGSVQNATINVTHAGVQAYGINVLGCYNSNGNTTTPFVVRNSTVNVTSFQTAYGIMANANIEWSDAVTTYTGTGGCTAGNIELTDVNVNATTTGGSTAYCAWASATYGTIADVKATTGSQSTGNATYKGEYAIAGKITINGGTYIANAAISTAYAVGSATRSKNLRSIKGAVKDRDASTDALGSLGGAAEAYPELIIHDGTFTAITGEATARAVRSGGYTTIDGGTFTATAGTSSAVAIEVTAGRTSASGVSLNASAKTDANGAYCPATVDAYSLYAYAGEIELNNCDVTVNTTQGTTARGVYVRSAVRTHTLTEFNTAKNANNSTYRSYGDFWQIGSRAIGGRAIINGGTYTINAQTTTAYGIHVLEESVSSDKAANASGEVTVKNATFTVKTNEGATAYGVYSGGDITIDGCKFTVLPKTTYAKGVYQYSNKATITNTTFDVRATSEARLFYADAQIGSTTGWDYHGEFELGAGNVCTAQSTGGNTAHILTLIANKRNIASGVFAGDYANASHAYVSGGSYKATATGTTTYVLNLSANQVQGAVYAAPSCTIEGGKFWAKADGGTQGVCTTNGVVGNILLKGGIYNINTYLSNFLAPGYDEASIQSGRQDYTDGYRYEVLPAGPHGTYVCQIGSTKYKTLEEALQVVTSGQVIYMIDNYTLPAGDYILPTGATLMVPYKDGTGKGASTAIGASAVTNTSATTPYLFRKLTFASGARLTCQGSNSIIETSAQQKANGQYGACVGMPSGAYGQIHLEEGAHIELESGSKLYCWGYITGKGTINVKSGATSLEGFQLGDWCGGTNASSLNNNSQKVFPITHYFYQSIECPITYRPGASAIGSTHIYASSTVAGQDAVKLVGTSGAMFLMSNTDASKDTWVMKDYDEETDQCVWTVNNGASVGNLSINMSAGFISYNFESSKYDLPITTNMTIIMNYGSMGVGQNTVFLPGSKLIVNKEGTASINGVKVMAYDVDDWTGTTRYYASYSPTWGTNNPRKSIALRDAEVFVHGKINITNSGGLYTSAGGANVHSTNEDAGEVIYTTAAQGNVTNHYYLQQGGTNRPNLTMYPAKLKNEVADPAFSESAGTSAGKTWTYKEGLWQCWTKSGCLYKNGSTYYVKPAELVRVTGDEPNEDDLLYYGYGDDGSRRFVWDENCYWWEVNPTPVDDGIYQSINEDHNGKLNCYEFDEDAECWLIKNVTVTWNGDGVSSTNYSVGYNTKPKWFGATPIKSGYVWDGWQINGAGTVYSNDDLPVVTANTTFTSHFTAKVVQYNVTFKNDDGKVLDSRNWVAGSTPSYSGTPEKEATVSQEFIFNGNWSPAITTVSAAAEYTAQYNATTRQYEVKFLDYDNTELEASKQVAYGDVPSFTGTPSTPERIDPTDTYIYEFSDWKNQQTGTIGRSAVNGDQTYVAQYTHRPKWFNIRFVDYNGTTLQTGNVLTGTKPTAPENPSRESDAQYTYEFTGWSSAITNATENKTYTAQYSSTLRSYTIRFINGDDVLQTSVINYGETPSYVGETPIKEGEEFIGWDDVMRTVSGDKDYHAQFDTKRYTFSVVSNDATYGSVVPNVVIQIPHGSAVSVNENSFTVDGQTVTATPTPATPQYTYSFVQWSNLPAVIEDDIDNVTAVFSRTLNQYTITWKSENGGATLETDENQEFGTATSFDGTVPTKDATAQYTYTFDGWATEANGIKVYEIGGTPSVSGAVTYYAHFSSTVRKYDITWLDGNGETLKTEQVAYGQTPAYTGTAPTKTATAQYTYTFNNTWTPAITSVTGAATYTAQFNSTVNNYTLTIAANAYGSVDETSVTVPYGSEVTVSGNTFTVNGTTVTATPTLATAQYTYAFVQWNNLPATVTGNVDNVEAEFSRTLNTYLITWLNDDDSEIDKTNVEYGAVPTHADATKANTEDYTYVFLGWDNTPVAVTGEATYKATYKTIPLRIEVNGGDDGKVDVTTTVTTTIVHENGELEVTDGNTLTTNNLILEGTPTTSGEITGAGTIDAGRALFHYSQSGGFKARTWYAVAVPWQVDVPAYALGGVYLKKGEGTYVQQTLGSTFDLIYYNGELRATGATKAWNYVENDDADKRIMIPGRAYMIYLTTDADTIRFERKSGTALHTSSLETQKYGSDMGANFADWNGIANPATYHAYLNVGATENRGQVYNADTKQYELFDMSANKLVVGQPIFVQPAAATTIVANASTYANTSSPAPRRVRAEESPVRYELYLAPSMDVASDRIIVRMDDEKEEDEYMVGQDLAKMGVSSLVPQMWINRYDSKMCINTVAPANNKADYPLGISVPENGEYDIFIDEMPDGESTLYLTYDGKAIWNLTYSAYIANLEKGTNTHYGLRIVRKAPTVVTDIEEATILNGDVVRKVIIEDKVFIIRNGEMYSVTGQKAQ